MTTFSLEDDNCWKYLGDGCYAGYDGYNIVLRTNSHRKNECHDEIALDSEVYQRLLEFKLNLIHMRYAENKEESTGNG